MKTSIRKLVAGSLVCVMAAGSAPFMNFSPIDSPMVHALSPMYFEESVYGISQDTYSDLILCMGRSTKLNASLQGATPVSYTYESSDPSVFTIDETGLLTPVSEGEAVLTVTATLKDGGEQCFSQNVIVMEYFRCGNMAYGPLEDGSNIFLKAAYDTNDITRICIPRTINGIKTTVLGKECCAGYHDVKFIEVPDTVTTIEDMAFAEGSSLEFVMIPKSVTKIADSIFANRVAPGSPDPEEKIVIKGYKGTAAEDFAKTHEDIVTFEAIEGDYVPYKLLYSMEFEGIDHYKELNLGEEYQFAVTTDPEDTDETITFTSENSSIVSISADGSAVAKQPGTTTIKAVSTTGVKKAILVTVLEPEVTILPYFTPTVPPTATPTVPPTATPGHTENPDKEVGSQESELYLQEEVYGSRWYLDQSLYICMGPSTTVKISSSDNSIKNVSATFESSDSSVFTIDENGVLTPKSVGTATLTIHAKSEDGKVQTLTQEVEVLEHCDCGGMAYAPLNDDELIFLSASYENKDITRICIPKMINEDVMTELGKECCAGFKNVTFIEVPDSITTIGERAFADNDSLEFVMIPKSVTEIADSAFGTAPDGQKVTKKTIIKGYKGTAAEKFAKAHSDIVTFEAIEGDYVPYKLIENMEFEGIQNYKQMEVGDEYQFTVKTEPEVTDEKIRFESEDESILSITADGASVAKKEGFTTVKAISTTGIKTKMIVAVSPKMETIPPTATPSVSPEVSTTPTVTPSASPEVSTTPTVNPSASPEVSTTPTVTPSASPEVSTTPTVTPSTTPEVSTYPTPLADYAAQFRDGTKSWSSGWYPHGRTSTITLPEPEKREGYQFLGWSNGKKLYQPGEQVEVTCMTEATFVANWAALALVPTPDVDNTDAKTEDNTDAKTEDNTDVKTEDNIDVKTEDKKEDKTEKEATLKIVTSKDKKFAVGKKYTFKAKTTKNMKNLRWSVSNKKIATINAKTGVFKAKKSGKVTITATCGNLKKKITIKIVKSDNKK